MEACRPLCPPPPLKQTTITTTNNNNNSGAEIKLDQLIQVQHEILQKRRQEKKETLEAVKKFKRRRGERPSFLGGGTSAEEEADHFPKISHLPGRVVGGEDQQNLKSQRREW